MSTAKSTLSMNAANMNYNRKPKFNYSVTLRLIKNRQILQRQEIHRSGKRKPHII